MAISGKLVVFGPDGIPIDGSIPVTDSEIENLFGCPVDAFQHMVFTDYKNMGLLQTLAQTRKHKPVVIEKPIDKMTATLYKYLTTGTYLPKVELRWYRHEGNKKELVEWFRITLEHVRVFKMKTILPNVKDSAFERYSAIDEVQFVYQRITWLRIPGHVLYTDEWNGGFYDEFSEKDFNPKKEGEEGYIAERAPYVLAIAASGWDHQDDNRRKESPNEVREGDKILLQAEVDGNPRDGESVRFEIYYQEPKGSALHFVSVPGKVKDSFAAAEWTVDFTNINKKKRKEDQVKEFKVHFEAVVQKKYGKQCPFGLGKPGVPVAFYEYPYAHESKLDSKGVPAKLLKDLCEYHETALLTPTRTGPVLVKEKWVYVFAKKGSGLSLFYECKPAVQGEKQTFGFVSWSEADTEKNQKSYPRPTTGKSKDTFALQSDREYYVFISQIQLSLTRIDYYTQHADTLAKRALHITANTLKSDSAPVSLYCTDYIEIAFYLREQYDKHVQSFEKFVSDKEKVQRRYLTGLVCAVAESKPRLKGWIDYNAVVKERVQNEQEIKERLKGKDSAEAHLREWKLCECFQLTREDYTGIKEIEEKILSHDAVLTSVDEIKYLETEATKKDSWYNTIFSPDSKFVFFRKLEMLASNKDFWNLFGKHIVARYLANFGPTKWRGVLTVDVLVQRMERFLDDVHVITEHANITFPDLVQNKGKWFTVQVDEQTKLPFIDYEFNASGHVNGHTNLETAKYRTVKRKLNAIRANIDKTLPSLQKVLIAIEAVNLANALYLMSKSDSTKDRAFGSINAVGSVTDLLASFEHIGKKPVEDLYKKSGIVATDVAKYAERAFARINLVGAICDYVGALKDIAEASAEGNNGIAAGYATIALASIASGTAATMTIATTSAELASLEASAAVTSAFGLSATTLGVVGIALFVAGAGIVWVFSDSELHEWAKKSTWAKDEILDFMNSSDSQPARIDNQIEDLHKLICEFTADSYLYAHKLSGTEYFTASGSVLNKMEYLFTVRVRPGYINEQCSKYKIDIKIIREGGFFGKDRVILDRKIVVAAAEAHKVRTIHGEEHTILTHRFSGKDLGLTDDFHADKFTYALSAHLDFYGDGTQVLFDVKNKGVIEILGSDASNY